MSVPVPAKDEGAIEVLASGLPLHHSAQLAVDITIRSATTGAPFCKRRSHIWRSSDGSQARQRMEVQRALGWGRCRLVVVGVETSGRWSPEAVELVDMQAGARAREAPSVLRRSAHIAWRCRWRRMLAVSCARAFVSSLVSGLSDPVGTVGATPDLADVFQT